jgi:penicillin-binding protein 2
MIVAALVLLYKVAEIQIFDSSYSKKAESTTLDRKTLYPSRGLIFDRNHELLVYNNPIYDIRVVYNQVDQNMDKQKFCRLLEMSVEEFEERLEKDWSNYQYSKAVPFIFLKNIPAQRIQSFEESLHEFPGFSTTLRNVRGYNHKIGSHMLGYISEVDRKKIESSGGIYGQGDYIGTTGIEHKFEDDLRGKKGVSYILKDNLGREVGKLDEGKLDSAAVSGRNLLLSIDRALQEYGEALLNGKKGSVVAIEPKTGEILAMISAPNYDPALLTIHKGRGAAYEALQKDTLKPFFDRSVMAEYPPGSIFKPVMALVAMQEGVLASNRTIYCDGAYTYRYFTYGCHDHTTPYNVATGLQHSCNSYFFQTFRDVVEKDGFSLPQIGLKRLNRYLYNFGLGRTITLDIESEKSGNVPTPEFYDKMYGAGVWRSTYIMSMGIGQGELQLTTLQMANLAATIGNRGWYMPPHLVKSLMDGEEVVEEIKAPAQFVGIDNQHFNPVIEGMARAINAGTAQIGWHPEFQICGKTGTSQNVGKDHSVFFAFAPEDDPKIAIAVYIENGGWGATYAVPIGSLMIEKYLKGDILSRRKWLESRMLESNTISP